MFCSFKNVGRKSRKGIPIHILPLQLVTFLHIRHHESVITAYIIYNEQGL